VAEAVTYPNDWARLVGELMRRESWTQQQMADRAGVIRNTIRRWVSGETVNVSTASVRLVADAAGIAYELAARAVYGADEQNARNDDAAIADVIASGLPEDDKRVIIDRIHARRAEAEESLRRDVALWLRKDQAS
jgi:transcriptional regulator with XRE-family HTH domain